MIINRAVKNYRINCRDLITFPTKNDPFWKKKKQYKMGSTVFLTLFLLVKLEYKFTKHSLYMYRVFTELAKYKSQVLLCNCMTLFHISCSFKMRPFFCESEHFSTVCLFSQNFQQLCRSMSPWDDTIRNSGETFTSGDSDYSCSSKPGTRK